MLPKYKLISKMRSLAPGIMCDMTTFHDIDV